MIWWHNHKARLLLLAWAILILLGVLACQRPRIQGVADVIDGDTLEIRGQRIRLYGIDTPESGQSCEDTQGILYPCGQMAAEAFSDRIKGQTLSCEQKDTDDYGRMVAVCHLDDVDLNEWLVKTGHALAYRQYSSDYIAAERIARRAGHGIWAGRFIEPWDWRKDARLDSETPPKPDGCDIKGNISQGGERIYHLPEQEYYSKTQINIGAGERWFCTEAEAQEAGWRKARQRAARYRFLDRIRTIAGSLLFQD